MAVNESRSMTADLFEGISDGMVKKLTPDRGGMQDDSDVVVSKSLLHPELYDANTSVRHKIDATARVAYDRYTSTPHEFGAVQMEACNVCGNTGCACGDLTRY